MSSWRGVEEHRSGLAGIFAVCGFVLGNKLQDLIFPVATTKQSPPSLQQLLIQGRPLTVGTVHDAAGLSKVRSLRRGTRGLGGLDVLEARLDSLNPSGLKLPPEWPLPVIATARHPREGGAGNLPDSVRGRLLGEAASWASAVDLELRSARRLSSVIATVHQHGRTLILSHHDFAATPGVAMLKKLARRAAGEGADLFKVATFLRDRGDLMRLIEFQTAEVGVPVVAMGMGPAGRFSRMVLAGFGAPLCYGWLGSPQVPGQWPALELPGLLAGLMPS